MTQEILEILIGKHLDGEITPGEQRILDVELDRDPRAAERLGELRDLHERSSELIGSCVLGQGTASGDIFEQAWQQAGHGVRRTLKRVGYVHVAVGVAAGFVMGFAVQFVRPGASAPQNGPVASDVIARNVADPMELEVPSFSELPVDPSGNPIRNVDWYNFTDKLGNQWLIEGLRESTVRPAAYSTDL